LSMGLNAVGPDGPCVMPFSMQFTPKVGAFCIVPNTFSTGLH
jgi:hypothetical protein